MADEIVLPPEVTQAVETYTAKKRRGRPPGWKKKPKVPQPDRFVSPQIAAELRDLHLGGDPEKTGERDEKLDRAADRQADAQSSASERKIRELQARLQEREAELAKFKRGILTNDWNKLDVHHPFEVIIQQTGNAGGTRPASFGHNGKPWIFEREVAKVVPRYIVEQIERTKYRGWEKIPDEQGNIKVVLVQYHTYPFSARPLLCGKDCDPQCGNMKYRHESTDEEAKAS